MKIKINNKILMGISLVSAFCATPMLQGCQDEEAMKWVDLRYRVEDAYTVEAVNPEIVSFQVKSTDPWNIHGAAQETLGDKIWYTITPENGEASDETTTVEVSFQENKNLDPRVDTLSIQSDYWTGKQFTVTQKGCAYLNIEGLEQIPQLGGEETFNILSNQAWTAELTEGDLWLTLGSELKGGKDYEITNTPITVKAESNTGEARTAVITFFDHNGVETKTVKCVQKGVILTPQAPDNGSWWKLEKPTAQTLSVSVESNGEWTASKENEEESNWFTIEQTDFSGNGIVKINIEASTTASPKPREGVVLLTSKVKAGAEPVVKTIRFKQANLDYIETTLVNKTLGGQYDSPEGLKPGRYNVYIDSFVGNFHIDYKFFSEETDLEKVPHVFYWCENGKTKIGTRPWTNYPALGNGNFYKPMIAGGQNVMSVEFTEQADKDDPTLSWIHVIWYLNGNKICETTADGWKEGGVMGTDDFKLPYSLLKKGFSFRIYSSPGPVTVGKWEYVAPINWGE